jgi:hypothetical protein
MNLKVLRALLCVMLFFPAPLACWANETKIVLREHLNQPWTNELLSYPFSAAKGDCDARSVSLTGPQGPVPVQLSQVECWPGTPWVKSAKLSFIADLAPLAEDTYVVSFGARPGERSTPATDLTVTTGKDQVEMTTGRFGVRLLLGEETYPAPVPAAQVPAPAIGMRLTDGTWFGGSRLFGEGRIVYTWEDGHTLTLTVRLPAGSDAAFWSTEVSEHRPHVGWDLLLSPGLPPLVHHVMMEFFSSRQAFLRNHAKLGDWAKLPLADLPAEQAPQGDPWQKPYAPGTIQNLTPWEDWWDD